MRAFLLTIGLTSLLGLPAAAMAEANSHDANSPTKQIESTVHQYLMKKPEVVVEALQAYQQKQMESMQKLFKETQKIIPQYVDVVFHHEGDPLGGNPQGDITLVEFSDYQCSHCIEVYPIVDKAMKDNPNLRIVIKEFPVRGIISENAAVAALAANRQGKYWAFREALFKASGAAPALSDDKILEVAQSVGLNMDQLKKDMQDKALRQAVTDNQVLAKNLKLVGTPAFFVAKTSVKKGAPEESISYIPGIISQEQLQTLIDQAKK